MGPVRVRFMLSSRAPEPRPLPARERAQAFVIREWIDRPQVVATCEPYSSGNALNRHGTGQRPLLTN